MKTGLRKRRLIWPLVLVAMVFAASNQSEVAGPEGIPNFDKLAHFAVFGLLSTLVIRAFFDPVRPWRSVLFAIAFTSLYGLADEFHQSFTPGRDVEFGDWMADTLGACLAASSYGFWGGWRRLLESRPNRKDRREADQMSMDERVKS